MSVVCLYVCTAALVEVDSVVGITVNTAVVTKANSIALAVAVVAAVVTEVACNMVAAVVATTSSPTAVVGRAPPDRQIGGTKVFQRLRMALLHPTRTHTCMYVCL